MVKNNHEYMFELAEYAERTWDVSILQLLVWSLNTLKSVFKDNDEFKEVYSRYNRDYENVRLLLEKFERKENETFL